MKRTAEKFMAICLAIVLAAGCITTTSTAASKGYQFKYKGVTVSMHGKAASLIKKAGKPVAKKAKKSCAYKGLDRTYKYKNFILYTYTKSSKGAEYVNGITFLNNKVATKEGIRIGSTYKSVTKKYGKVKGKFGVYTYKKGKSKLQIEVTNNKVTNIRYITAK
ncbi:MAG: hypothetical protein SO170_01715 [Butyribacter sp.]|nr:hypothetical protein [bacterium]MDY3853669.1 hypothetical protein [Butyribacter sp.]